MNINEVKSQLKIEDHLWSISTGSEFRIGKGSEFIITSPVDGKVLGTVNAATRQEFNDALEVAKTNFQSWRNVPAPQRGEVVRQIGDALRANKEALGYLVSYEMGKSLQEGLGEVQEMIDICDFAVGLSRQLYGLSMHSERQDHRMFEQWHPLGVVGIISAFNFPVAVWAWNAMISWVCGNVCLWKPSEKTPLTAIACQNIVTEVFRKNNLEEGLSTVVIGDKAIGQALAAHRDVALVSATGSTAMGKSVAQTVASRLGKVLLELGGNNAIIVTENADFNIAVPGAVFGAVGTCGQRCTSTRRLIIQESIYDHFVTKLVNAYGQLKIGSPLDENNHVGPLIDRAAVEAYRTSIDEAIRQGGKVLVGNEVLTGAGFESGCYVKPTVIEIDADAAIVKKETFAPILYLMKYGKLDDAIAIQNSVDQGLSSAIFTLNMREAETFLSSRGSDCGIANVNIGTSGAEIGGAFGGEKETGGGRESGSDAWKAYMRRQTCTSNWSAHLPLAQGIKFDL